jgi:DNA-binding IclR family transcriptional regulator
MLLTTRLERELPALLRRANALESDPARRRQLEPVLKERRKALEQGWSMSLGTSTPGAAGLAILLPVPRHHDPMTLGLGGPTEEIRRNRTQLLALLNDAVATLRDVTAR